MLARLICLFLGHTFDKVDVQPIGHRVYLSRGKCLRCHATVSEIGDLLPEPKVEDPKPKDPDTVDERTPRKREH